MSDPKDLDYAAIADHSAPKIMANDIAHRFGQIEALEYAMGLCFTGSTPAMIRRALHNKLIEITGEGEKA